MKQDAVSVEDLLFDQLTTCVEKAGVRVDRKALQSIVVHAAMTYGSTYAEIDYGAKSTLHELPAALERVRLLLGKNWFEALTLFGKPPDMRFPEFGPDVPKPIRDAIERHDTFLRTIATLAHDAPPPPQPGRGRPRTSEDFKAMVFYLAQEWEKLTGKRPKQGWHEKKPTTPAANFIYNVVGFLTPDRTGEVRQVLAEFIRNRRRAGRKVRR